MDDDARIEAILAALRQHQRDGRKSWVDTVCTCGLWRGPGPEHSLHVALHIDIALGD